MGVFDAAARRSGLSASMSALESRLAERQLQIFELLPEVIPASIDPPPAVVQLLERYGFPALNTAVSKNDLMYWFLRSRLRTAEDAIFEYLRSGIHMMQVVRTLAGSHFQDLDRMSSFLDFASGYGRLTRFLVGALPNRVWVADVKSRAVDFQRRHFGVHGFVSAAHPDKLAASRRFDCVFVGSLFSHLPPDLFDAWFARIYDLVHPSGLLILTVHDVTLADPRASGVRDGYVYARFSEEGMMVTEDVPLPVEQYGSAYVAEDFFRKVVHDATGRQSYVRYPRGMWDFQDVYVITSGDEPLVRVNLPTLSSVCL